MEVGRSGLLLRLRGDGKYRVALFPMESFDIVSPELPPSWIVSYNHELFKIGPERWMQSEFWEQFYELEPAAIAVFDEEVARLIQ